MRWGPGTPTATTPAHGYNSRANVVLVRFPVSDLSDTNVGTGLGRRGAWGLGQAVYGAPGPRACDGGRPPPRHTLKRRRGGRTNPAGRRRVDAAARPLCHDAGHAPDRRAPPRLRRDISPERAGNVWRAKAGWLLGLDSNQQPSGQQSQALRRAFNATASYRNFARLGGQNRYAWFDDTHAAMFIVVLLAANPSAPRCEFPSTPAGLHAALGRLESEAPRLWHAVLALEPWNIVRFPETLLAVARQPLTGLCPTDTDIRDFEGYVASRLPSTRSRERDVLREAFWELAARCRGGTAPAR